MPPNLRCTLETRTNFLEGGCKIVANNDMTGFGHVNAMQKRRSDKPRIHKRDHAADLRDAEPCGEIIGTTGCEQTNNLALADAGRERPARVTVDAFVELAIAEGFAIRQQGGMISLPSRPVLDHVREQVRPI